jgi:seryl-tRNA synthetase
MKKSGNGRKVRAWTYLSPPVKEILSQKAREEHTSESDLISSALAVYLTKDIVPENLLMAQLQELKRQIESLSKTLELQQKLDLEWYQFNFLSLPELPAGENERNIRYNRAASRFRGFLSAFRRRSKTMPAFTESIFGEMLEESPAQTNDGKK